MKSFAIGCGGILIGLIAGMVLVIGANQFLSRTSASMVDPPPQVTSSDVSITASTAFLAAQMQQTFKQSNLARQATFAFASPNLVRATMLVDVPVLGKTVQANATVTCHVAAQNGKVILAVDNVDVAGMNVPQNVMSQMTERVRSQIETQMNQMLQRMLQGTTLRLVGLGITSNEITMQFKAQ